MSSARTCNVKQYVTACLTGDTAQHYRSLRLSMTPLSELQISKFGIIKMSVIVDISYMGRVIYVKMI
jgi:hypothetical protein